VAGVIQIEYRGEDPEVPIKKIHKMTVEQCRREMAAVGLVWKETQDLSAVAAFHRLRQTLISEAALREARR
jgi:hypothetical protein